MPHLALLVLTLIVGRWRFWKFWFKYEVASSNGGSKFLSDDGHHFTGTAIESVNCIINCFIERNTGTAF